MKKNLGVCGAHPLSGTLSAMLTMGSVNKVASGVAPVATVNVLDSANEEVETNKGINPAAYADANLNLMVASAIHQWVETDDLDEGESLADRLLMLFIGIVDANKDGELNEAETTVLEAALSSAWDYFASKGVSDEDCSLLLNDWDVDAALRVSDLISSALPDGEDASDEDIDAFAFDDSDQEAVLDAAYKKTLVIRHGKKVRINKRISGTVRLSAKQKVGIRKAQMKSHSAVAIMRRMKSRRIGAKMGL